MLEKKKEHLARHSVTNYKLSYSNTDPLMSFYRPQQILEMRRSRTCEHETCDPDEVTRDDWQPRA